MNFKLTTLLAIILLIGLADSKSQFKKDTIKKVPREVILIRNKIFY